MKLLEAEIVNFRSIKKVTLSFDPACRILVGINESGKSNLLKALSFLQLERLPVRKDDVRESLPDEDEVKDAYIRFYFRLDKNDADEVYLRTRNKIFCDTNDPEILLVKGKSKTLAEICLSSTDVRYFVDLLGESKSFRYVGFGDDTPLIGKWKKPSKSCPDDFEFQYKGKSKRLKSLTLLDASIEIPVPPEFLADADLQDFSRLLGQNKTSISEESVIRALFWEYDEKNLLPSQITMDSFAENPDTCLPLKNMFLLGGVNNVKEEIARIKALSNNQAQNFFDRIASKTTSHFRSVWKEYQNIEFKLRLDADRIIPAIKEKNSFDFSKRSDGFKRFVTFLLMISVNVTTDTLTNALLLIDEPDSGLHPSGARYLRDELIRISAKNYVVYTTHSIFMIDTGNIERHYIVKKESEVTSIVIAKDSNVADEEVLYNALGFSLFEVLKPKNIIFEGWRDKKLFWVAQSKTSAATKKIFKDVGVCHAKGAKHIKAITPMIELAKRYCLIISDLDAPAKEQRKQFLADKGFGDWKIYQDVIPASTAVTGEDFVKNPFIVAQVKAALTGLGLQEFPADACPDSGKIRAIEVWLKANGLNDEQAKDAVGTIKGLIFEKLSAKDIEDSYIAFLDGVAALMI